MRNGIVGAGIIGSTLAKLWANAGHEVRLASRHPEQLKPFTERLGPTASAGTPVHAATFAEVVLLTVPLKAVARTRARSGATAGRQGGARYRECL